MIMWDVFQEVPLRFQMENSFSCTPVCEKKHSRMEESAHADFGVCGGKGGGKPDSAMGGGKDMLKLDDALASVDDFVAVKLGL